MPEPARPFDARGILPLDKFDVGSVQSIAAAGYPAIAPILDDLVGWTADSNWPVARPLAEYLITLDDAVVAPLSRVLRGGDASQKEHCIRLVVMSLPVEVLRQLEGDLRHLAESPTEDDRREGADDAARDALSRLP